MKLQLLPVLEWRYVGGALSYCLAHCYVSHYGTLIRTVQEQLCELAESITGPRPGALGVGLERILRIFLGLRRLRYLSKICFQAKINFGDYYDCKSLIDLSFIIRTNLTAESPRG